MTWDTPDNGAARPEAPTDMDEESDSTAAPADGIVIAVDMQAPAWGRLWPDGDVRAAVRAAARAALDAGFPRGIAAPGIEVSLVLTDDAAVQALNRTYRGHDTPTNVLAFGQESPPATSSGPVLLGDVVLALETVCREAAAQGKRPIDHVRHLVVHGVLHLLGLDHNTDPAASEMEGREIAILAALGIADPYADGAAAPLDSTPEPS